MQVNYDLKRGKWWRQWEAYAAQQQFWHFIKQPIPKAKKYLVKLHYFPNNKSDSHIQICHAIIQENLTFQKMCICSFNLSTNQTCVIPERCIKLSCTRLFPHPTFAEQTVRERGRNSSFLIGRSVFHHKSFKTSPTIGWQTSCGKIIWNTRWRFYFLKFLPDAYKYL